LSKIGFSKSEKLRLRAQLALLILIYLRSRSRPTLDVSSLMLFDEAPAPVASVQHVRLDRFSGSRWRPLRH